MSGSLPTGPFTAAEIAAVRHYCGYAAYAAYGYVLSGEMAVLDTQLAAMSPAEQAIVRGTYLTALPGLEAAVQNATANLDTDQAAVWVHNKNEVRDRRALYLQVRRDLAEFCGVQGGPALSGGGGVIRT